MAKGQLDQIWTKDWCQLNRNHLRVLESHADTTSAVSIQWPGLAKDKEKQQQSHLVEMRSECFR